MSLPLLKPSSKYPNQAHDELKSEVEEQLKGKQVTLVDDGFFIIHNDPIIATSVQWKGEVFFVHGTCTGSMPKTAQTVPLWLRRTLNYVCPPPG